MAVKRLTIATLIGWLVLIPLVCFTNVLAYIPGPDLSLATRRYWQDLARNPDNAGLSTVMFIYAGPMIIIFLVFWFLWLRKNLQEILLAAYARSFDIHAWLQKWADLSPAELPPGMKNLSRQAQRILKNLDRLVVMANSGIWSWWYCGYLPVFYIFHAPKIAAYSDVRIEPPPKLWPAPESLARSDDRDDLALAKNALDFSRCFTDGVKAWTGLEFLLHSLTGAVLLGILSVLDRRITQGSRSLMGRQWNGRIWTVLDTCRKQGRSAWEFLQNALSAYYFQTPTPSLLPQA